MTTGPGQRVVLAVQGGSQILLPANFQGGSINLKSLQGLKMIPIQQQQIIQNQTATGKVNIISFHRSNSNFCFNIF